MREAVVFVAFFVSSLGLGFVEMVVADCPEDESCDICKLGFDEFLCFMDDWD
jgi:hypothetical protein